VAKTVAPLLSFDAAGQIAKTQVYATWKGRPYVRRYVVPANPNTAEQQLTRNTFKFLNDLWKYFPQAAAAAWTLYGDNNRITNRNAWLKANISTLREATDLDNLTISPSAGGGIAAAGMNVTPGSSALTVDLTAPALPAGWTIVQAWAAALRDQDPQSGNLYIVTANFDASTPYAVSLTGLIATQVYQVAGWFEFMKPDGTKCYGQNLRDQATPTA